jgi:hypothetical protein
VTLSVERSCIVCGQKSHRVDWVNATYPVCDSHSKLEVQNAIWRLSPQQKPSPVLAASQDKDQTQSEAQPGTQLEI